MNTSISPTSARKKKVVRIAGLEPARIAPLPPQSSVSANSTICATACYYEEIQSFSRTSYNQKPAVLTETKKGGLRSDSVGSAAVSFASIRTESCVPFLKPMMKNANKITTNQFTF